MPCIEMIAWTLFPLWETAYTAPLPERVKVAFAPRKYRKRNFGGQHQILPCPSLGQRQTAAQ